jgi:chemotaxis protein CheX
MEVKFINPFVYGTVAAMKKITGLELHPGKVYLKERNAAAGDVSGIIGITGDATGYFVISFPENCICNIVSGMRGELHAADDRKVIDAIRDITRMILVAAGASLEKEGLKILAALPTVVYGKSHTIAPLLDSPSISIPFATAKGTFVVDICLQSAATGDAAAAVEPGAKLRPPDVATNLTVSDVVPVVEPVPPDRDRQGLLKKQLAEAIAARDELMKQLAEKPFMEIAQRTKFKKMIPVLDGKIKRLKLDITALDMMAKITPEELENPVIANHYQHHDNQHKR